jgi:hypothetical protein
MNAIVVIILVLLFVGAFPRAGAYSEAWGYGPFGGLGLVLLIIVVLIALGRL